MPVDTQLIHDAIATSIANDSLARLTDIYSELTLDSAAITASTNTNNGSTSVLSSLPPSLTSTVTVHFLTKCQLMLTLPDSALVSWALGLAYTGQYAEAGVVMEARAMIGGNDSGRVLDLACYHRYAASHCPADLVHRRLAVAAFERLSDADSVVAATCCKFNDGGASQEEFVAALTGLREQFGASELVDALLRCYAPPAPVELEQPTDGASTESIDTNPNTAPIDVVSTPATEASPAFISRYQLATIDSAYLARVKPQPTTPPTQVERLASALCAVGCHNIAARLLDTDTDTSSSWRDIVRGRITLANDSGSDSEGGTVPRDPSLALSTLLLRGDRAYLHNHYADSARHYIDYLTRQPATIERRALYRLLDVARKGVIKSGSEVTRWNAMLVTINAVPAPHSDSWLTGAAAAFLPHSDSAASWPLLTSVTTIAPSTASLAALSMADSQSPQAALQCAMSAVKYDPWLGLSSTDSDNGTYNAWQRIGALLSTVPAAKDLVQQFEQRAQSQLTTVG